MCSSLTLYLCLCLCLNGTSAQLINIIFSISFADFLQQFSLQIRRHIHHNLTQPNSFTRQTQNSKYIFTHHFIYSLSLYIYSLYSLFKHVITNELYLSNILTLFLWLWLTPKPYSMINNPTSKITLSLTNLTLHWNIANVFFLSRLFFLPFCARALYLNIVGDDRWTVADHPAELDEMTTITPEIATTPEEDVAAWSASAYATSAVRPRSNPIIQTVTRYPNTYYTYISVTHIKPNTFLHKQLVCESGNNSKSLWMRDA